ncbi:MAG: DinB family protein, partial [Cyclobacteriaceae bacterium]
MQLIKASNSILSQLASIVEQIQEKDYVAPCPSLGKSSIGQHLRHTLEFFICLESGCELGVV